MGRRPSLLVPVGHLQRHQYTAVRRGQRDDVSRSNLHVRCLQWHLRDLRRQRGALHAVLPAVRILGTYCGGIGGGRPLGGRPFFCARRQGHVEGRGVGHRLRGGHGALTLNDPPTDGSPQRARSTRRQSWITTEGAEATEDNNPDQDHEQGVEPSRQPLKARCSATARRTPHFMQSSRR